MAEKSSESPYSRVTLWGRSTQRTRGRPGCSEAQRPEHTVRTPGNGVRLQQGHRRVRSPLSNPGHRALRASAFCPLRVGTNGLPGCCNARLS